MSQNLTRIEYHSMTKEQKRHENSNVIFVCNSRKTDDNHVLVCTIQLVFTATPHLISMI